MKIKRKDLEILLQGLEGIASPKVELEQYPTPARVAANLLWIASFDYDDIYEKTVADLGCGTGTLGIGAAYLGAKNVVGVDIDCSLIKIAQKNSAEVSLESYCDWICCDVRDISLKDIDTVVMNPPFGMRKESLTRDRDFVAKALEITDTIYSINPYDEKTREFFKEFCVELGAKVDKIIWMEFEIKRQFDFHKKEKHTFFVDLYRIIKE
ncbi:MAG: METTL5 family protein [Candidatus Heimdallarchaeota archaeon]